jgi:hypothetical protein
MQGHPYPPQQQMPSHPGMQQQMMPGMLPPGMMPPGMPAQRMPSKTAQPTQVKTPGALLLAAGFTAAMPADTATESNLTVGCRVCRGEMRRLLVLSHSQSKQRICYRPHVEQG